MKTLHRANAPTHLPHRLEVPTTGDALTTHTIDSMAISILTMANMVEQNDAHLMTLRASLISEQIEREKLRSQIVCLSLVCLVLVVSTLGALAVATGVL